MELGTLLGVVGTPLELRTAQGMMGKPQNTQMEHPRGKGTADSSGGVEGGAEDGPWATWASCGG